MAQNPDEVLRLNEWWHARNIDYLRRAIQYAQSNMPMEVETMMHAYIRDESARLSERAMLMQNNKIESYPHQHRAEAQQLFHALQSIIDERRHRTTVQDAVQESLFEEAS
jgi:hypothetical protein